MDRAGIRKTREAAAKVAEPIALALNGKAPGEAGHDQVERSATITAKGTNWTPITGFPHGTGVHNPNAR